MSVAGGVGGVLVPPRCLLSWPLLYGADGVSSSRGTTILVSWVVRTAAVPVLTVVPPASVFGGFPPKTPAAHAFMHEENPRGSVVWTVGRNNPTDSAEGSVNRWDCGRGSVW